jgi:hypothetical protein
MARGNPEAAAAAYDAALRETGSGGSAVEVGFEALTPAYLALALSRTASPPAERLERLLKDAACATAAFENPHLGVALDVLDAAVRGVSRARPADPTAVRSSDVRRALAFSGTRGALRLCDAGRRMVLPDGRAVDLSRRKNVIAILVVLARERRLHPGTSVEPYALVAAGWPGEKMRAEAATKRLHTAIWTLRKLGLDSMLVTSSSGEGYYLSPTVPLEDDGVL